MKQITLEGEIVQEYYYKVRFVPADVVRTKKDEWFIKLGNEQMKLIEEFLVSKNQYF